MIVGDDSMRKIYTSVDIGSDSIKVVVLELHQNKLNLLAVSSVKSSGIKKGLIINANTALSALQQALKEVENMLGIRIKKVLTLIPMHNAQYIYSKEKIKITEKQDESKKVTGDDINNGFRALVQNKIQDGYELVTIHPIDFAVDDRTALKDPKGLSGEELGCRGMVVTTPKKNIYSVVGLIESAGIEVVDVAINSIGDSYTLRNSETSQQVGAIINIGAATTTVAIYNKGIIIKGNVIPIGGQNIDSDIAYIFKLTLNNARELKEKFACAHRRYASPDEVREVTNIHGETIKINQYELSEVVMFRMEEILELVKKELNALTNKKMHYIILTGGVSHLTNLQNLAEDVLEKKVSVGNVRVIGARNNKFSSVIGSVVYFINKLNIKGKEYSMFSKLEQSEISEVRKGDSDNTVINRIFGFFTNE